MAQIGRGARALVTAALAISCSSSDQARGPGADTGRTDSASLAASTASPRPLRVSNVMIGRRVGAGNRIIEPTFQFAPKDTVHISVGTEGSGSGPLTAAWRSQSGEILLKSVEPLPAPGENAGFSLAEPKGLKPGNYKVIIFLADDSVDTKVFVVKK